MQELKAQDDQYVKYLKKQAEEVDLIIERMEEQAHTLLRAHRQEMTQIENSFTAEREALRDKHKSVQTHTHNTHSVHIHACTTCAIRCMYTQIRVGGSCGREAEKRSLISCKTRGKD